MVVQPHGHDLVHLAFHEEVGGSGFPDTDVVTKGGSLSDDKNLLFIESSTSALLLAPC